MRLQQSSFMEVDKHNSRWTGAEVSHQLKEILLYLSAYFKIQVLKNPSNQLLNLNHQSKESADVALLLDTTQKDALSIVLKTERFNHNNSIFLSTWGHLSLHSCWIGLWSGSTLEEMLIACLAAQMLNEDKLNKKEACYRKNGLSRFAVAGWQAQEDVGADWKFLRNEQVLADVY